ncbi:YpoC family protein [Neobacillus sp. Marseille-QA0830]
MNNRQETFEMILSEWDGINQGLQRVFREREDRNADAMMKQGIYLFIRLLYITNELEDAPHSLLPVPFPQLKIKPINLEERLEFIKKRPGLFHSYRQLSELMIELEKLYVKESIKKSSRSKS